MKNPNQLIAGAVFAGLVTAAHAGCTKVYTLSADFAEGLLFNLNSNAPNSDQLQLNDAGSIQTLPVMYVANAGEDTISKLNTTTNAETARYRSWFGPAGQPGHINHPNNAFSGAAPSRSAVDADGNCYVGNRGFSAPGSLMKILNSGFIDRNGNGVMDTSVDTNMNNVIDPAEILPMADNNPANGMVDQAEIRDERVAWIVNIAPAGALLRSVSIAPDGAIWVGLYSSRTYQGFSSVTGGAISAPISTASTGHTPYGSLIFSNGDLYSASLGSVLGKLVTGTGAWTSFSHAASDYGIGIGNDPNNGNSPMVILGGQGISSFFKFNATTNSFSFPASGVTPLGVSVDSDNNIFCSDAVGGGQFSGCSKFSPDGSLIWSRPPQTGAASSQQRGAIVDANGDVWTVNVENDNVSKFDGADGTPLGVIPVGDAPYTYSDASGSSFIQTNPSGTWEVVYDTGERGAKSVTVSWNGSTANGSTIDVVADASDSISTIGGFDPSTATPAGNGIVVPAVAGRYIYVRARLTSANQTSPVLSDLTIKACPKFGDVNNDCCVDRTDFNLVLAEIRSRGSNPVYDVNGDGAVNIADARRVAVLFCNPVTGAPCD
jgi:hypothetical protein